MKVIVKLCVPNAVYRFYKDASRNVAGQSPEAIMSDALSAYATLLSEPIAKETLWKESSEESAPPSSK